MISNRSILYSAILAVLALASKAYADEVVAYPPGPPIHKAGQASPPASQTEVVVVGTPDGPFPVTVSPSYDSQVAAAGRAAEADAHFFSRCVKPFDNGSLHELIDGKPNRDIRAAALNRIVRGYMACYPGYDETVPRDYGTCNARFTANPAVTLCQSFYDRGALVEKMLATYAPELSFDTEMLAKPLVLRRYHAREDAFNTTRSKGEIIFAEVAECIVAIHPHAALDFLKTTPSGAAEQRMRTMLLGTSSACVGGAKQVMVDPSQFRVLIADAVYSWAVALKGTKSLIPYDPHKTLLH